MDKSEWMLLDEPERLKHVENWLDQLLELDDTEELTGKDREKQKELKKKVFQVFEWLKDYD